MDNFTIYWTCSKCSNQNECTLSAKNFDTSPTCSCGCNLTPSDKIRMRGRIPAKIAVRAITK